MTNLMIHDVSMVKFGKIEQQENDSFGNTVFTRNIRFDVRDEGYFTISLFAEHREDLKTI